MTGRKERIAGIEEQVRSYEKNEPYYARAPFRSLPYAPANARAVDE
jgi:hypothetical protein